jgi:hypothetical protein
MARLGMALAEARDVAVDSVRRVTWTMSRIASLIRKSPGDDQDPVLAMLASAPVDNEPLTDDDRRHIEAGWQDYRDGRVVSSEDAKQGCLHAKGGTERTTADRTAATA